MTQLTPIQLDNGAIIYLEATEDIEVPPAEMVDAETEEQPLTEKGRVEDVQRQVAQSFQAIENTIKAYTTFTLDALKQVAVANIEEVTLEFGVEIGGSAGIPYVTKGTAKSNLKITVKCSFPSEEGSQPDRQ